MRRNKHAPSADLGGELSLCFLQYVAKKLCMQLLLVQNQYLEGVQAKSKSGTIIKGRGNPDGQIIANLLPLLRARESHFLS